MSILNMRKETCDIWNQRDTERSSTCWFIPQRLQQLELSQAEAMILELSPGLPQKRQSSKHLNAHLLPPRVCISTEVESETEYLELRILIRSESKEQINCFASLLPAELLWHSHLGVLTVGSYLVLTVLQQQQNTRTQISEKATL